MSAHLQWKRVVELAVGTGVNAVLIKDLRIKFKVTKTRSRRANQAEFNVYNMRADHEDQLGGEFTDVLFNVGYVGATRMVFRGNVRGVYRHREDNDQITQIDAGDGDQDIRTGVVNLTLGPNTDDSALVDHILTKSFSKTKRGHVALGSRRRIRGEVFSGDAALALDRVAEHNEADCFVQDGVLNIVPVTSTLPNEAVVLRSDTGLLGAPEITTKGIKFRCLLNPDILVGGKVSLDNNALKARVIKLREAQHGAKPTNHPKKTTPKQLARLDKDGIYKVIHVEHHGDNRADEFYTDGICVALEKSIPAGARAA